ncbi:hypothetical protein [Aneurinibacillus thermoaerophilus]|uniref:hypothetical protein n=1 Tax=Aneurinibacillus thermoaerophilus TaxID=143495 RepID=UPI0020C8A8CD|nr:hypothetical protein [Aneurinibacillus thermoaerophilus]
MSNFMAKIDTIMIGGDKFDEEAAYCIALHISDNVTVQRACIRRRKDKANY